MNNSAYKIIKNTAQVGELFLHFKDDPMPFLLESSQDVCGMGRYSFFGSDPFLVFSFKDNICRIERRGEVEETDEPALSVLRRLSDAYKLKQYKKAPVPFLCGAVGYFAYDFGFSLEKIRIKNKPDSGIDDLRFGFYDTVLCRDNRKNELIVFSSGFPESGNSRKRSAEEGLKKALQKLQGPARPVVKACERMNKFDLVSNFSKAGYLAAVRRAQEHIAAGDIYQVNLSQEFKTRFAIDDWSLYRRLAGCFPVSFSAFLPNKDFSIISASPERFLRFDGKRVLTRPMKGTRPRAESALLNKRMKKELEGSKKEKAELLMIVDLERNDLGRVCEYSSIKVRHLRHIEAYRSVFQATAEVEGVLHKTKDRVDLIRACFPGGSVTGCPKIRAMEIIDDIEPNRRGIYTGSLGYISFHDTLEFNILIRSFLKRQNDIRFCVGGGIVSDSTPEAEYRETLVKAKALKEALARVI